MGDFRIRLDNIETMLELARGSSTDILQKRCNDFLSANMEQLETMPFLANLSHDDLCGVLINPELPAAFNAKKRINLVFNWMSLRLKDSFSKEDIKKLFNSIDVASLSEKDLWDILLKNPSLMQNADLL